MIDKKKQYFRQHKNNCERRGIDFEFTYDEWCAWWLRQLGPNWMQMRGCRRGQYVMARYYDDGPYAGHNVKAIQCGSNVTEYNRRRKPVSTLGWKPLPDLVVAEVYLDEGSYTSICTRFKQFGLTKHKVQCIKQKKYYKKITDCL